MKTIEEKTCIWKKDDDDPYWETSCGETWSFTNGGIEESRVRFCHGCGEKIKAVVPPVCLRCKNQMRYTDENFGTEEKPLCECCAENEA